MRILNREDMMNILLGCTILGTGGGGSLDEGIRIIDEALAAGKSFRLVSFDELDPDAVIGTPYACGAISPLTEEEKKKYARLKETEESMYLLNMKQIESFLRREVSAVISTELGGGNTAVEDAIFLARFCSKVTLVHRRDSLRASKNMVTKLQSLPNVTIIWDSVVEKINGDGMVSSVILKNVKTGEKTEYPTNAVFVAVGTKPNNLGWSDKIPCDESGCFIAGETGETGIPGIFAAGDVRTKNLRQIITAAADGANAVYRIEQYLAEMK